MLELFKGLDFDMPVDMRVDSAPINLHDRNNLSNLLEWAKPIEGLATCPTEMVCITLEEYQSDDLLGDAIHQALLDGTKESLAALGSIILSLANHLVTHIDPDISNQFDASERARLSGEERQQNLLNIYKKRGNS